MISINIEAITKKTGKNISQIARESGINRNTIQAMALGKVNGIKFETLEKLCSTFGVELTDILVATEKESPSIAKPISYKVYKQEGEIVPFTVFPPFIVSTALHLPDGKRSPMFGRVQGFFKETYGELYLDEDVMRHSAETMYAFYKDRSQFDVLYRQFSAACSQLHALYARAYRGDVIKLSSGELVSYFQELNRAYRAFWGTSIFIDAFDVGVDQEIIKEIGTKYHLSKEEVQSLTTPVDLTFSSERRLALLKIAQRLKGKKMNSESLLAWLKEQKDIEAYKQEFDYVSSNYAIIKHQTDSMIAEEILQILAGGEESKREIEELSMYSNRRLQAIERICKAHRLKENPLWFFERLTYWRETRKQYNLMGIHALHVVLSGLERITGIPHKYLQFITFDEVQSVLRGSLTADELRLRRENGFLIDFEADRYSLLRGEEARSVRMELEDKLASNNTSQIIYGQVASQGYAKGVARVILDASQFDRFQEGEILVTGMTRPEFVPLMKKAAAIVTNEGGITCHAAIVSRELGKPCIIGTKNATSLIPDGAMVEVRANHGTVRVL